MTEPVLHFEERDGTWYLAPDALKYGAPELLKEHKSSHTRRLRPMEVEAIHELAAVARQWQKFLDKIGPIDSDDGDA